MKRVQVDIKTLVLNNIFGDTYTRQLGEYMGCNVATKGPGDKTFKRQTHALP
jgi:hypothetical protein